MLGNLKNMGAIAGLLSRREEIARAAGELGERIAALRVEGSAGGGACRAWVTGKLRVERVAYEPAVLASAGASPEAQAQLERLAAEAVNDAMGRCQGLIQEMIRGEARRLGIEDLIPASAGSGPFGGLLG